MITKTNSFKTSVNIKFDLGKEEFINRYLPTPSHAESLLGLLKGFNNADSSKAHIVVGPYGTGKSLVATIVGGLVSKQVNKRAFATLSKKFNKVHDEIYQELNKVNSLDINYLTVALNGNEGRFRSAITGAISRALTENKIDIVLPGQSGKIIQMLERWKEEYPKTFKVFKRILREHGKDLDIWRLSVLNQEKAEIDWFISIYPELSSGAEFVSDYQEDFIGQIKFVLDELKKQNLGLFIAYDEFGRMLQTLELTQIHETMQDLQDLAELTDHYSDNLHLLLITHRNMGQYFSLLHDEFKSEFQRIEKRFHSYYVESDSATFIRIADSYLQYMNEEISRIGKNDNLINYLRKYPLFPELNDQEIEKLIIEGTYPIHPVTLYLLPRLSSVFGQNERTLFTFLESNETGGLQNHIETKTDYYLPSDLFRYFFPNLNDVDINTEEYKSLKVYKKITTKTPQINSDNMKSAIVKFITLWELSGLQSKIKLDADFLSFALNINYDYINQLLEELVNIKAVRYNRVLKYWELMEGSSVIIDELITDKIPQLPTTNYKKLATLEECLDKRYFLANEYNDEKSMTRYAEVQFLFASDILHETINFTKKRVSAKADAIVYYVITESKNEYYDVLKALENVPDSYSIFCVSRQPYGLIKDALTELTAIDNLLSNVELMSQDQNLQDELLLRKEDTLFTIQAFNSTYTSYNSDSNWIYAQNRIEVKNEISLEKKLSEIMFRKFPLTVEVRNDSFNRKTLNNMQRNAGYNVLDHIINSPHASNLGIEGQGPDYLIYATIFKNNHFSMNDLDNIKSEELKSLRSVLLDYLESSPTGNLQQFLSVLSDEPYGIRDPLIPLLLVSLLRDKWDQLMFYRNDMFIAGINGEKFYKMAEEADQYQFVYYQFDKQFEQFFSYLEENFQMYENELVKNKPRIIRINNALLTWLRSLPRFTQISNQLNSDAMWLKDTVKKSEINPQETLTSLFEKYKQNYAELLEHKKSLEGFYEEQLLNIERKVLEETNVEDFSQLKEWASTKSSSIQKNNKLVRSILQTPIEPNWIQHFAYQLVGIELENWSDTTTEMFRKQVANEYQDSLLESEKNENEIQLMYNGKVKSVNKVNLSTKSQTIYNNIYRMINNAGRNVPKEEVEFLVYRLLDEFIE